MSSAAFVLSAIRNPEPVEAIRLAVERADVHRSRVQDVLFGFERSFTAPNPRTMARKAGLSCPAASVSSSMRAVAFGTQSILEDDLDLVVVAGVDGTGTSALVLAGTGAIGRWNLVPRARLAAHSLQGSAAALRKAGITSEQLAVVKQGECGTRLLCELLDDLEARQARWGMVVVEELAFLVERV